MPRVLLVLPSATYRAADFLRAARAEGAEVVVASGEPLALGSTMGPRGLHLPLDDPDAAAAAIVAHDRIAPLDAVVAVDDQGTLAAARAAASLGLRHNPPDAVLAARDKVLMRRRLDAAEVRQPRFAIVGPLDGAEAVEAAVRSVGLPCVVKPACLSGSQGVIRVDDPATATDVVGRVRRIAARAGASADDPILIERFAPGPEVAVEAILDGGRLRPVAVFDKPDPLDGPYFEETIYVTPSRLDAADRAAVLATTAAACRGLGLSEGPVHAELRVDGGRVTVIEVAARTIGGLCARTLTFGSGRSLEQLVLAHALGRPWRGEPGGDAAGVLMIPIPGAGTFTGIGGRDRVLAIPGVVGLEITVAVGRPIVPLPEGDRYLGFVFARAATPAAVEDALRLARDVVDVGVTPDPPPA